VATYYVDAATGDDGDTGLTEALAFATIGAAMTASSDHDFIYVKGGTDYSEAVVFPSNSGKRCFLIGYSSTPGDSGRAVLDCADTYAGISMPGNGNFANMALINFEIKGATNSGITYTTSNTNISLLFHNCYAHDCATHGLYVNGTAQYGVTVSGCTFAGNTSSGIATGNNGNSFVISDSLFYGNGGYGVFIDGYGDAQSCSNCVFVRNTIGFEYDIFGRHVLIYGCTFAQNTSHGLKITNGCVRNSHFYANGGYGITSGRTDGIVVLDNINSVSNVSGDVVSSLTTQIVNAITSVTPSFTAPYNSSTNPTYTNWDYTENTSALQQVAGEIGALSVGENSTYHRIGAQFPEITGGGGGIFRRVPRIIGA